MVVVVLLWLTAAVADRVWLTLDRSVPSWDEAKYLNCALEHWRALQTPDPTDASWWTGLWMLASKIPPLTCLAAAPFMSLLGLDADTALLAHVAFTAVLVAAVHGLGARLFGRPVGLTAAAIVLLMPGLTIARLTFSPDLPLASLVALALCCLAAWPFPRDRRWPWMLALAVALGLGLLTKQAALLFLLVPIAAAAVLLAVRRDGRGLVALAAALGLSAVVWWPWYRVNWLLMLTGGKRAVIDAAALEGDPAVTSLAAWTYYPGHLPALVSWPLLALALVGVAAALRGGGGRHRGRRAGSQALRAASGAEPGCPPPRAAVAWLLIFVAGGLALAAVVPNKDPRYALPVLPALAVLAAAPLAALPRRTGGALVAAGVALALLLAVANLWAPPVPGLPALTAWLSPHASHPPSRVHWPHDEVVASIARAEPDLRVTLAVLPSTPEINQHNVSVSGAQQGFRVSGRQVAVRLAQVPADVAALSWFLTKTGNQGSVPGEAQAAAVRAVRSSRDFRLHGEWTLPDGSVLELHRRMAPWVAVERVPDAGPGRPGGLARAGAIALASVTAPATAPPGQPMPVTYEWLGDRDRLRGTVALLTWRPAGAEGGRRRTSRWIHDHAIAMGRLHDARRGETGIAGVAPAPPGSLVRVTERTATLPPPTARGTYSLEARAIDRRTGEVIALAAPPVKVTLDPAAPPRPAPPLDLVTQLRELAAALPQGPPGLPRVFEEIGRIAQYDPGQDYAAAAEVALQQRLREQDDRQWAYALALARVLRRRAGPALAVLERLVEQDPTDSAARGYLAFVALADLAPRRAERALEPLRDQPSAPPETHALRGAALLMQGRAVRAWHELSAYRERAAPPGR